MLENLDFSNVLNVVLMVAAIVGGGYLALAKGKLKQIIEAGKQLVEVGQEIDRALSDNKITDDEKEAIKKEWLEAKGALKAILKKKE